MNLTGVPFGSPGRGAERRSRRRRLRLVSCVVGVADCLGNGAVTGAWTGAIVMTGRRRPAGRAGHRGEAR